VVESVYSAVRTDALYKEDYVSSFKGLKILLEIQIRCVILLDDKEQILNSVE